MNKPTTIAIGGRAEQAAAAYLQAQGYDILQLNYRRPHCEIDIVARITDCIYFVEVKYRATNAWGDGLDYITPAKLRHMERAAESWIREYRWGGEYTLSAISVGGSQYEVTEFITTLC